MTMTGQVPLHVPKTCLQRAKSDVNEYQTTRRTTLAKVKPGDDTQNSTGC